MPFEVKAEHSWDDDGIDQDPFIRLDEVIIKEEPLDMPDSDPSAHDSGEYLLSRWKTAGGEKGATEAILCEICDETFADNVEFGLHTIRHSNDNRYYCYACGYQSTSKYTIEAHIRAHDGTSKYKCEICNKGFVGSIRALEHKSLHTDERPFRCEICGKGFKFSWLLASHRRSRHWEILTGVPPAKYDCPMCDKYYCSSTTLKRHQAKVHDVARAETSSLCDVCGKSLASKEKLRMHRKIHTGFKPHSCSACPKAFARKEHLKAHERVHTREKPYVCRFCGKGFSHSTTLKIHERGHTGERPYCCKICSKGFKCKRLMDNHMKTCQGPCNQSLD